VHFGQVGLSDARPYGLAIQVRVAGRLVVIESNAAPH
jgi:hypothetical protein